MRYTDVWNDLTGKIGLLGRFGQSLHYLRTKIHGNSLVAIKTIVQQRFIVQRLHHSTVFSKSRNWTFFSRTEPTNISGDVSDTTIVAQFPVKIFRKIKKKHQPTTNLNTYLADDNAA